MEDVDTSILSVNALSGLYLISTRRWSIWLSTDMRVNALSGLYLISTRKENLMEKRFCGVNALSGLYLISTPGYAGF